MNMDRCSILVTGCTGLLGSNIFKILLEETNSKIYLLVRARESIVGKKQIKHILDFLYDNKGSFPQRLRRVQVICGDITLPYLGLNKREFSSLIFGLNFIYHCAANTNLDISRDDAYRVNVQGTKNIVTIANSSRNLIGFNYISTVYIAGFKRGYFQERDFDIGQKFGNYYEESKFAAEKYVRENTKSFYRTLIHRPSIIMGDYFSGKTINFNVLYRPIHIFARQIIESIPADRATTLNIIPADIAAKAIVLLSEKGKESGTFHIISSNNIKLIKFYALAAKYFHYSNPDFVNLKDFDLSVLTPVGRKIVGPLIHYFNHRLIFKNNKTRKRLAELDFRFPIVDEDYIARLFQYCEAVSYMRRK